MDFSVEKPYTWQRYTTGWSRKNTLENNGFLCYQQYFLWTTLHKS